MENVAFKSSLQYHNQAIHEGIHFSVIHVIIKQHKNQALTDIYYLFMEVKVILVINVIIKQVKQEIYRFRGVKV